MFDAADRAALSTLLSVLLLACLLLLALAIIAGVAVRVFLVVA